MTAVLPPAPRLTTSISHGRRIRNGLATAWMVGALVIAAIPLTLLVIYVVRAGAKGISAGFFTKDLPFVTTGPGGGMAPAIVGTLLITAAATLVAVPLGVLAAIYLNEYGGTARLASVIRFLAEIMTGVPSVVMGLFIFTIFTLKYHYNGLGGALALGCLMLPIVIRSTEEMLKLVPAELRQGSLALGCPLWRTIVTVVLPAGAPGIVSGAMLAVARAAGETAPLLFTIGLTSTRNWNIFSGTNTTLSVQIFNNASNMVYPAARDRAWAAALTLVAIVLLFSIAARLVSGRFAARTLTGAT
jgi:phosphate transport system permease protein